LAIKLERSVKGSKLHPFALTDAQLLAIGRLIRACAEIDDIIHLYLCHLADIHDGQAIILLGRMSSSAKLKIAAQFCVSRDKALFDIHKECFDNEYYYGIVKLRNTVAHGILLGKTDEGTIAFQVQETIEVELNKVVMVVNAYEEGAFEVLARMAEGIIPQLETRLMLGKLRGERRARSLSPYQRRTGRQQKAKHGRQHPKPRKS